MFLDNRYRFIFRVGPFARRYVMLKNQTPFFALLVISDPILQIISQRYEADKLSS